MNFKILFLFMLEISIGTFYSYKNIAYANTCTKSVSITHRSKSKFGNFTYVSTENINYIDLPDTTLKLSGRALKVPANKFVHLTKKQIDQYDVLYTNDIITCVAILIKNALSENILLSHFLTIKKYYETEDGIKGFVESIEDELNTHGDSLTDSTIQILWGRAHRPELRNRIDHLISSIALFNPDSIHLDSTKNNKNTTDYMSIHLNLKSGQLSKTNYKTGEAGPLIEVLSNSLSHPPVIKTNQ